MTDETIEALKPPREWAHEKGMWIRSPDGWRVDDKSFDEPITEREFRRRASMSTVER